MQGVPERLARHLTLRSHPLPEVCTPGGVFTSAGSTGPSSQSAQEQERWTTSGGTLAPRVAAQAGDETWRLLCSLPQELQHAILSMADALERLEPVTEKPAPLSEAAKVVQEVSLLSRCHPLAARSAPVCLRLRWWQECSQASFDAVRGAAQRGRVEELCLAGPLPPSRRSLATRLRLLGSQLPEMPPGPAPGPFTCVSSLTLTNLKEGPDACQAVIRASQLPELPQLSTLHLLYYRRAYLAGLGSSVQHVHLTVAGAHMHELGRRGQQVAGEDVAPLGSLPAHRLASLSIQGNDNVMDLDVAGRDRPYGRVVLLDVARLCSAAVRVRVRVHTMGLPMPCAALGLPACGDVAWSRPWALEVLLAQWLLDGGAESLDVSCWAFQCYETHQVNMLITTAAPASPQQLEAAAAASFAAAAAAQAEAARQREAEHAHRWLPAGTAAAWEQVAAAAQAQAEAGGASLVHISPHSLVREELVAGPEVVAL